MSMDDNHSIPGSMEKEMEKAMKTHSLANAYYYYVLHHHILSIVMPEFNIEILGLKILFVSL